MEKTLLSLDRLDRKVLHMLDMDPCAKLSSLAKRLRLGSDLVEYRLKKYQSMGLIRRFTPFLHPQAFGFGLYKTYVRHRLPKAELRSLLRKLDSHERLHWLVEGYGRWDLLFSLNARSVGEYQRYYDEIVGKLGKYILDQAVYPVVSISRYSKKYLTGVGNVTLTWRSDDEIAQVDDFECRLLKKLSLDSRISDVALAKNLGSTPAVVAYRRAKLEKGGAILGYRMQLDYDTLGMIVVKIFIQLKSYQRESREELEKFCEEHSAVTCFIQQLGDYSIEIEIEVERYHDIAVFFDALREKFSETIGRIDHMIITKDYFHRVPGQE